MLASTRSGLPHGMRSPAGAPPHALASRGTYCPHEVESLAAIAPVHPAALARTTQDTQLEASTGVKSDAFCGRANPASTNLLPHIFDVRYVRFVLVEAVEGVFLQ